MSRLVLILGILLVVVGMVGMVVGVIAVPFSVVDTVNQAQHPDPKTLCQPGEQLATEEGPEAYDSNQGVYDRSTTFYCVNAAGVRRDVTQQFAEGFLARMIGAFGSVAVPFLSCGLCGIGVILLAFGAFFSRRRALRTSGSQVIFGNLAAPRTAGTGLQFDYIDPSASTASDSGGSPFVFPDPTAPPATHALDDLAAKLAQLEEAHTSGLITDEEYQRKRQEILDAPT